MLAKKVVVIGGGDSALEEAIFLTRYASHVTIVHRRDTLRAGAILQNRAIQNAKISFVWNAIPISINGEEAVRSITLKNVQSNEETLMGTDGIFIFIGHKPNSSLFTGQLNLDPAGYILIDQKMQTNRPGIFAAGEIADPIYRQVVTSAGMGAAAGIQASRYLESLE
jgi:thioredoxin reductase (NADPH)